MDTDLDQDVDILREKTSSLAKRPMPVSKPLSMLAMKAETSSSLLGQMP
jgi:hypothetical protein